ncbi:nucleoporin Nup184 [Schizosaccharomyces japonicus yFS275]|uniref:Nucleoporin Nup184 n=1 Tax=Schizosaccharomyces japonicus (strain yFS275 / FY16936) TaxID=402676 RepID=B6JVG4_SCHJY|nr:nucleoporin Nup184 [Schizosaccharomyces japonicus yFS275]EEB05365.2 nucleoporin Nup184 [Schizosaccharomyces japonicus yFS275]
MDSSIVSWTWILDAFQVKDDSFPVEEFEKIVVERLDGLRNLASPLRGSVQNEKLCIYGQTICFTEAQQKSASRLSELTGIDISEVLYVLISHNDSFSERRMESFASDSSLVQTFTRSYNIERLSVWKLICLLLSTCSDRENNWHEVSRNIIVHVLLGAEKNTATGSGENAASQYCVQAIQLLEQLYEQSIPTRISKLSEQAIGQWYYFHFSAQLLLEKLIFALVYDLIPCTAEIASAWFECMRKSRMLQEQDFVHLDAQLGLTLCRQIVYLAVIVSVEFIALDRQSQPFGEQPGFFMLNGKTVIKVHEAFMQLAGEPTAAPACMAWGIALHLLDGSPENLSVMTDQKEVSAAIFHDVKSSYQYLIRTTVHHDLFSIMSNLLTSLKGDPSMDRYCVVLSLLFSSTVSYVKFTDSFFACASDLLQTPVIRDMAAEDEDWARVILRSKARFPYDFSCIPIFFQSLDTSSWDALVGALQLETLTQALPEGFKAYEIIPESQVSTNILIELQAPLDLPFIFEPTSQFTIALPAGTRGRIISTETYPPVVIWMVSYNAWSLLGKWLYTIVQTRTFDENEDKLHVLIPTCAKLFAQNRGYVRRLAILAAGSVGSETDFVNTICDVFDYYMSQPLGRESQYDICVASLQLLSTFVRFSPAQVWAYITHSALISSSGRQSYLEAVLTNYECVVGNYDFTISFFKFYDLLVSDCINTSANADGFSVRLKMEFMGTSLQSMCEIFSSFYDWCYKDVTQQYELGFSFVKVASKIIHAAFGIELYKEQKETTSIHPIYELGSYLVDKLLVQKASKRYLYSVFSQYDHFDELYATLMTSVHQTGSAVAYKWVLSSFEFLDTLIRLRGYLNLRPSELEKELFSRSTSIISALPQFEGFVAPLFQLLTSLVLAPWTSETPSLLAYLIDSTDMVGKVCTQILTNPLRSDLTEGCVWKFLSSLMKGQQQGLAVLLFSGKQFPLKRMKNMNHFTDSQKGTTSLTSIAEKRIADLPDNADLQPKLPIFEFVFLARNFWSSTYAKNEQNEKFWNTITRVISSVQETDAKDKNCPVIYTAASNAFRIAAVQLFMSQSRNNTNVTKLVVDPIHSVLDQLIRVIYTLKDYDHELHAEIQEGFQKTWKKFPLLSLKNTGLVSPSYGEEFFYNISLAQQMLGLNPKVSALIETVKSVNVNLSVVDAQVTLLRSCSLFLSSLADYSKVDSKVALLCLKASEWILESVQSERVGLALFNSVYAERAQLVFRMSQQCANIVEFNEENTKLLYKLLYSTWKSIMTSNFSLYDPCSDTFMPYYRSLVRALYNLLNVLLSNKEHKAHVNLSTVAGILYMCHRKLSQLFEKAISQPSAEIHADIVLFNSLHELLIDSRLVKGLETQIVSCMVNTASVENCVHLLSWSHELLLENQPYFADAAITFLVACSKHPIAAEQIVNTGLFTVLLEARVFSTLRNSSVTAEGSPILHRIWTRGILPLMFQTIKFLGNRIQQETREMLLSFIPQIQTSLLNWRQLPQNVNLAAIDETFMIVLLFELLQTYNPILLQEIGAAEMKTQMMNGVDYLITHPNYLSTLATPASVYEQVYAVDIIGLPKEEAVAGSESHSSPFANLVRLQLDKLKAYLER